MSKTVDDLVRDYDAAEEDVLRGSIDGESFIELMQRAQRAAIAAVAEWMIDEFSYQAEMIEIKRAMVAALRAAAGSALEAKP